MSGVWPILRKVSLHILPNLFAAQKSHQTRVVFVSHIGDSPTRLRQRQQIDDFGFNSYVRERGRHFSRGLFRFRFADRKVFDLKVLRVIKRVEIEVRDLFAGSVLIDQLGQPCGKVFPDQFAALGLEKRAGFPLLLFIQVGNEGLRRRLRGGVRSFGGSQTHTDRQNERENRKWDIFHKMKRRVFTHAEAPFGGVLSRKFLPCFP